MTSTPDPPPTAPVGPSSSTDGDASDQPRPAHARGRSGRASDAQPPGPGSETIGRGHPATYVGLLSANVLLVAMIVYGFAGGGGGLVILGLILLAFLGLALYSVHRTRLDLDGSSLHVRWGARWAPAVDLDRLTSISVDLHAIGMPAPEFMQARWMTLVDADGASVSINRGFTRTRRLDEELASRIDAGTVAPDMNARARRAVLGRKG